MASPGSVEEGVLLGGAAFLLPACGCCFPPLRGASCPFSCWVVLWCTAVGTFRV